MKLIHKLLLLLLLPLVITMVLITMLSYYQSESIVLSLVREKVEDEIDFHIEKIGSFFDARIDELKVIADTPVVQRGNIAEILRFLDREQKRLAAHIEGLYYNDVEGMVYSVSGKTFSVRDRYYFPAIDRGETVITKAILSRDTHRPIVLMLVPIFDAEFNRIGAIGGTILLENLFRKIAQIKVGQTGFALLVDEDRQALSGLSQGQKGSSPESFFRKLDNSAIGAEIDLLIDRIISNKMGSTRLILGGETYNAYYKPIENMKWYLALVYKEAEILSGVRRTRNIGIAILSISFMFVLAMVYGLNRALLVPIRKLAEAHRRFGEGDISVRAREGSRDEIGVLSRSFNQMVDQLNRAANERRLTDRALQELVAERTAELREVNAEIESFAYSVSHDLRAPLRAMQGFAQALLEDYADRLDSVGQDYAQRIVAAARRMDALIHDLLAYSRLSRADMELHPVDLGSVVSDVLAQLEAELQEHEAQVTVEEPLPQVVGHHATLVQVMANLLTNAVKFVPPGVQPKVRIWAEEREEWVRLWVEDNGIGIAPEHQERIFRVFERLHGIETYPGTGIGLAVVYKGVERMGGRVGVESKAGQGSRFWAKLPKVENSL